MTDSLATTIDRALRSAGLGTEPLGASIRTTIDRALEAAGLKTPAAATATTTAKAPLEWVERVDGVADRGSSRPAEAAHAAKVDATPPPSARAEGRSTRPAAVAAGSVTRHRYVGPAGERAYRLYIPASLPPGPAPLVVMLHGCRQDPDDFARGTRMDACAETAGCLVVYPEQPRRANGSSCWNWFQGSDQHRDRGEPAILAGIVHELLESQPIDPRRVYVAGLSAGASMAVILGRTYPDLFAAVGAHSGLPYGAAHDVGSAFAAMMGGAGGGPVNGGGAGAGAAAVPTIVFHGDADSTVAPVNGDAIVAQALAATQVGGGLERRALPRETLGGRGVTRTLHLGRDGRAQVEQWRLHGTAHVWSGGDPAGSFTEAEGPDASAEMLRFFLAH